MVEIDSSWCDLLSRRLGSSSYSMDIFAADALRKIQKVHVCMCACALLSLSQRRRSHSHRRRSLLQELPLHLFRLSRRSLHSHSHRRRSLQELCVLHVLHVFHVLLLSRRAPACKSSILLLSRRSREETCRFFFAFLFVYKFLRILFFRFSFYTNS